MRPQPSRLPPASAKGLAGFEIDRQRPVEFRLDGRMFSAFEGDTVLTALLASGVDTIGLHRGQPIGLRPEAAPAIAPAGTGPNDALPMDRVPVRSGADYRLVAPGRRSGIFTRLFQPGRTLGLLLDDDGRSLIRPWRSQPGQIEAGADMLVIGGGVAGMSAALAATRAGLAVTLIEKTASLGGYSGLFGTLDGEPTPEEHLSRLNADIRANPAITLWTNCEAFAIAPGRVRVHRVETSSACTAGKVLDLPARFITLATGSIERLPVVPGNRRPGVAGAQEAYELARRYGIWPGHSVMLATSANPAYRLATLLADTTIGVDRITDGRDRANSRFIEFCKASGFRLFPGTVPTDIGSADGRVAVSLPHGEPVIVDRLILSGGWQPDLLLWHMVGGQSRWNGSTQRLEPSGKIEGIALAGAAAGYLTRKGCAASGTAAVETLLGRVGTPVEDPVIDPLYETPDSQMCALENSGAESLAYLDAEAGLMLRPGPVRGNGLKRFFTRPERLSAILSESPKPLSVAAISAGVALGLIPEASAGIIAEERVALIPLAPEAAKEAAVAPDTPSVPAYLYGRFGHDAVEVRLSLPEQRQVESGALIFLDHDTSDPLFAVGTVLRMRNGHAAALLAAAHAQPSTRLVVRDFGQTVSAAVSA